MIPCSIILLQRVVLPLVLVLGSCIGVAAMSDTVRGSIDQCYGVRIVDREVPFDSLRVDRALPDSLAWAYLLCVQAQADVDTTGQALPQAIQSVGQMVRIDLRHHDDSIVHISSGGVVDTALRYQLVVPVVADTIIVDSVLTTRAWNGVSGGVIVLEASQVLEVLDTIRVTGLGYRGGARSANGGECNAVEACAPSTSVYSGGKGESVVVASGTCSAGFLPWISGGGGGNSHNSGGGGGGNSGGGGRGGDQWQCGGVPGMYGLPGTALPLTQPRMLLFGGGGGGAHQNNGAGTNGASGGGIVVLRAPAMIANGATILAEGGSVLGVAGNDGAGGGGAGGTVVLDVCTVLGDVAVDVRGGTGGMADDAHGPGGGGGGGRALVHPALWQYGMAAVTATVHGGAAGMVRSGTTTRNASNGVNGVLGMLCDAVRFHTITVDTAVAAGDVAMLRIAPAETAALCDVLLSVAVDLRGGGLVFDTLTVPENVLIEQHASAWNQRNLTITLPQTAGIAVPLRAAVARDVVTSVTIDQSIAAMPEYCRRTVSTATVNVSACAAPIRPIIRGMPFALAYQASGVAAIGYQITSFSTADVLVRLINSQGEIVHSRHHRALGMVGVGHYTVTDHFDMHGIASGIYYLTAISNIGIDGLHVLWVP